MFKKIEIWILYLYILLSIPLTISFGILVKQELTGSTKLGIISRTALRLASIQSTIKGAIKGLKVEDRFTSLDGFNGTPNLNESYVLLSRYEGSLKEGIIELIDLRDFKVLHTWNPDIDKFNQLFENVNEFKYLKRDANNSRYLPRHPLLLKDGGLVFQNHSPLRKIDACSNLIFQNKHDQFHHSIETDIEGNIWVPSSMDPSTLPKEKIGLYNKVDGGYIDDGIVKLSPDGKILFENSVSQIFIDNGMEYLLFAVGDLIFTFDPVHLNDIQPVDFDGEFWKKGDVFLSLRNQSMVILYRPSTNKIIWKGTGPFFKQHDVNLVNDHKISIFNNNTKVFANGGAVVDGNNEVVIYDFKKDKYSTYLNESLIKNDVRTIKQGRSKILPNGDLFLEETDYGRILYFKSDGTLKWTYLNRADNGKTYLVNWSRILYTEDDLKIVNNFLKRKGQCND